MKRSKYFFHVGCESTRLIDYLQWTISPFYFAQFIGLQCFAVPYSLAIEHGQPLDMALRDEIFPTGQIVEMALHLCE